MRIALISFEYPPSVAIGGIGTYTLMASQMLASHGHSIQVYSAGNDHRVEQPSPSLRVQRILATTRSEFASSLVPFLQADHQQDAFDIIEAPEIGPEGVNAFAALPQVARVIKLHSPRFLITQVGYDPPGIAQRMRFLVGALRRGRWQTLRTELYQRANDPEFHCTLMADEIAAPSQSIANILTNAWNLDRPKVHIYPLPFEPSKELLDLPIPNSIKTIGFLGRLEPRKGVIELAKAIPAILRRAPGTRFRFIGPSWPYRQTDMVTWIKHRLRHHLSSIEFSGGITPAQVPAELSRCDALVLPSRWENFPYSCWEALASGRVVIGSSAGGMAEIIEPNISGLLVRPHNPTDICNAVLALVQNPTLAHRLAQAGRCRVLEHLNPARILPLQLASYSRAIIRATERS